MTRRVERVYLFAAYAAFGVLMLLRCFDVIAMPTYVVASLFALVCPIYLYFGPYQRRMTALLRRRDGLCRACGFDLRETPNRCPECGKVLRLDREGS